MTMPDSLPVSLPDSYDDFEHLTFERDDRVMTVVLNRPEALNAVSMAMHSELARVFHRIARDTTVHAVVLTGAGRAFCAGGDIKDTPHGAGAELDRLFREARTLIVDILELPQPLVAAVNGPAMGLGATLALFADLTVLSHDAFLADPHVTVGVGAGDGGAVIWPWLIGMKRAKEYLMTGDRVTPQQALDWGLVNRVVPAVDVLPAATALARRLCSGSVRAVQGTKAALNNILRSSAVDALDQSLAREKECFLTDDHITAVAAFNNSRSGGARHGAAR